MFEFAMKSRLLLFTILVFGQFSVAANKEQVSLEEASELIRHSTQGKIISAKTTGKNDLKSHRIQVLTPSGRVKIYQVPANNNKKKPKKSNNKSDNRQSNSFFLNQDRSSNSRKTHNENNSNYSFNNNRNNRNPNENKQKSKRSRRESKQK